MIDTKELRRLLEEDGKNNIDLDEIHELLDRLETAESEVLEQARLNGMGSEREATLMAKLEAAEIERDSAKKLADSLALALNTSNHERDNLRAKIAEMERQELGYRERCTPSSPAGGSIRFPLYVLPGAQGE